MMIPPQQKPRPVATVREALREAEEALTKARIDTAKLDARLLMQHAFGLTREDMLMHPYTRAEQPWLSRARSMVRRRSKGEPVSRILGRREFWSLEFLIGPAILDPRPDTETLVEAALAGIEDRNAPLRILDLGVGSGCLLLAVLSELPRAVGIGIDIGLGAANYARRNAEKLGLAGRADFFVGNWGEALVGSFDLVLSNPPYIPTRDIRGLPIEVSRFDPYIALDGGDDGLSAYRDIARQLPGLLSASGRAHLELGIRQAEQVSGILQEVGLEVVGLRNDLAGIERCISVRLPGPGRVQRI